MDMLIQNNKPVLLIGNAGLGKTVLINDKLAQLGENYNVANIPFNFYTTSDMLQRILEKPLEKKAGRNFGPPGTKKLIYFVDDLNMPEVCWRLSNSLLTKSTASTCIRYLEHFSCLMPKVHRT